MTGLQKRSLDSPGKDASSPPHGCKWLVRAQPASAPQRCFTSTEQGEASLGAAVEHGQIYRWEEQNRKDAKIVTCRQWYCLPLHSKSQSIFLHNFKLPAAAMLTSASVPLEKWGSRKHCQHLMVPHATLISLLNRI